MEQYKGRVANCLYSVYTSHIEERKEDFRSRKWSPRFLHCETTYHSSRAGFASFPNHRNGLVNHLAEHARRTPKWDMLMQVAQRYTS